MNKDIKAIVFDIDGTLSDDNSWTKVTMMLGASVQDHAQIYDDFRNGRLEYEESKKALLKLWRGEGPVSRDKLTKIFAGWNLKKDARELFDYLHSKGYLTCLITGGVDLFAQEIAKTLGVKNWYANTVLHWDENNILQGYDYVREADHKKLSQLKKFCEENLISVSECVAVGDDLNDVELFNATGRGILVESTTSHKLEQFSWKKVKELNEIKNII